MRQDRSPLYQSTGKWVISNRYVRVCVRHAFLLGANLNTKVWPYVFYHHPESRTFFNVKGQDSSPLYQSIGKRDNFKGFRTFGRHVLVRPTFLLCANLDTKVWPYAFYHHIRIKNVFAVKGQDSSPLYQSIGKRDYFKGILTFGCRVWVGPVFLLGAKLGTKVWPYAFYDHLRIKNAFAVKGQGRTPLYQSTRRRDNFKGFRTFGCRVWVGPAFLLCANFVTKVCPYASYHHLRIKNVFALKRQDRSPVYQSTGERDGFKGFRTRLDSPCIPILRKSGHKGFAICLLPSSWNHERYSCERARRFAFVSVE